MRRRLFTILSALSLLLCMATIGLWAYSFLPSELRVGLTDGRLVILKMESSRQFADDLWDVQGSRRATNSLLNHASARHGMLGFDHAEGRVQGSRERGYAWGTPFGVQYKLVRIHLAYVVLLLTPLPVLWLLDRWRRTYRARAKLCPSCGYDLRATPDRCPECGMSPQTKTEAAS